jgi:hypothetical protein
MPKIPPVYSLLLVQPVLRIQNYMVPSYLRVCLDNLISLILVEKKLFVLIVLYIYIQQLVHVEFPYFDMRIQNTE